MELARELAPALIVIDTQAVGVEENSNTEMGDFVAKAERVRTRTSDLLAITLPGGAH